MQSWWQRSIFVTKENFASIAILYKQKVRRVFCFREHRLPACCRRQLADDFHYMATILAVDFQIAFRQAAEKDRLAACAPQIETRTFGRIRLTFPNGRQAFET